MNTDDTTPDGPGDAGAHPTDTRPLGAWLRLVDRLISREFATALEGEDLTRRDWMLLNALAGTVDVPGMTTRLDAGGARVDRLADRGWITRDERGPWTLTDTGRAAFDRLSEKVDAVRAKVSGSVSDDEFAQLKTSLEGIARDLGWDETQPMGGASGKKSHARGSGWGPYGHGHGFGGFGHEFGERRHPSDDHVHEHGFGPGRHGFGPGHHARLREECERRHHGAHAHHDAEHAYERGFAAGFDAAGRVNDRPAASAPAAD